jgi:hypothetical protein
MQFQARNQAAFLSVPLAAIAFTSVARPRAQGSWARTPNLIILALLAVATLGWQSISIKYWSDFIKGFEESLAAHRGLITWEQALAPLPEGHRQLWRRAVWPWTNPALSFLLSPEGKVATIIDNPRPVRWKPIDPAFPEDLPQSTFFDPTAYREALGRAGPGTGR